MVDFSTNWSDGIIEVWKGQTKALIPLTALSILFAGITYAFGSNYWTLGAALAGLLVATFILMSLTAGVWLVVMRIWSEHIPENYQLTTYLKERPVKTRTASVTIFTLMFFILLYSAYSLSPNAKVVLTASGEPLAIGLKDFMYVVLGILAILLASMWYKHYKIVKNFNTESTSE